MSEDHGPRGGGGAAGARRAWLRWWVVLTVLWLALADSRRLEEVVGKTKTVPHDFDLLATAKALGVAFGD